MAATCAALIVLAFAKQGWLVFAVMPVFALDGVGTPALQARATRQVSPDLQGQFQGVLASAMSLASIVAPLTFTTIYFVVRSQWPGAIWLSVAGTLLALVPLILRATRAQPRRAPGSATAPSL
jgi:DHA1 family tetracycline resistance protein-like MFS transporter